MQYLVSEVLGRGLSQTGESKIFKNIPDLVKHLTKLNKGEESKLRCEERDFTLECLEDLLKERLHTAHIYKDGDPHRKWIVTAF